MLQYFNFRHAFFGNPNARPATRIALDPAFTCPSVYFESIRSLVVVDFSLLISNTHRRVLAKSAGLEKGESYIPRSARRVVVSPRRVFFQSSPAL